MECIDIGGGIGAEGIQIKNDWNKRKSTYSAKHVLIISLVATSQPPVVTLSLVLK